MTTRLPTRHITEKGPVIGHVYLAVRDKSNYAVKIGSTRYTPSQRLSQTKSCTQDAFLIACATTAARELEHYLHTLYAETDKKLPGQDDFDLSVEDVLSLALWFEGGTFRKEQGGNNSTLSLVDHSGYEVRTPSEVGTLLGQAARTAIDAQYMRQRVAAKAQEALRQSLSAEWHARTAQSWQIEGRQLTGLIVTGQLEEIHERARSYIRKGRPAPTPIKPEWVDSYFADLEDFQIPANDADLAWLNALAEN